MSNHNDSRKHDSNHLIKVYYTPSESSVGPHKLNELEKYHEIMVEAYDRYNDLKKLLNEYLALIGKESNTPTEKSALSQPLHCDDKNSTPERSVLALINKALSTRETAKDSNRVIAIKNSQKMTNSFGGKDHNIYHKKLIKDHVNKSKSGNDQKRLEPCNGRYALISKKTDISTETTNDSNKKTEIDKKKFLQKACALIDKKSNIPTEKPAPLRCLHCDDKNSTPERSVLALINKELSTRETAKDSNRVIAIKNSQKMTNNLGSKYHNVCHKKSIESDSGKKHVQVNVNIELFEGTLGLSLKTGNNERVDMCLTKSPLPEMDDHSNKDVRPKCYRDDNTL